MNPFLERIDPARKEMHLSDAELERRCGIPPKTVSKWRHTNLKSYVDYIAQLSAVLKKPVSYLLGEDEKTATPEGDGIIPKEYYELSAEDRATVDALIARLAKGD